MVNGVFLAMTVPSDIPYGNTALNTHVFENPLCQYESRGYDIVFVRPGRRMALKINGRDCKSLIYSGI